MDSSAFFNQQGVSETNMVTTLTYVFQHSPAWLVKSELQPLFDRGVHVHLRPDVPSVPTEDWERSVVSNIEHWDRDASLDVLDLLACIRGHYLALQGGFEQDTRTLLHQFNSNRVLVILLMIERAMYKVLHPNQVGLVDADIAYAMENLVKCVRYDYAKRFKTYDNDPSFTRRT